MGVKVDAIYIGGQEIIVTSLLEYINSYIITFLDIGYSFTLYFPHNFQE